MSRERFLALVTNWREETIDEQGVSDLKVFLRKDSSYRKEFRQQFLTLEAVTSTLQEEDGRIALLHELTQENHVRSRLRPRLWHVAAVAAAAIFLVFLFLPSTGYEFAHIRMSDDVTLTRNGQPITGVLQSGDTIQVPEHGEAVLQWQDASTVTFTSKNNCVYGDGITTRLQMHHGKINASVTPQASGKHFRISTPQAVFTVIGTEFSLQTDGNSSFVHVHEGTVAMQNDNNSAVVMAGQSAWSDGLLGFSLGCYLTPEYSAYLSGKRVLYQDFAEGLSNEWRWRLQASDDNESMAARPWADNAAVSLFRQHDGPSSVTLDRQQTLHVTCKMVSPGSLQCKLFTQSGLNDGREQWRVEAGVIPEANRWYTLSFPLAFFYMINAQDDGVTLPEMNGLDLNGAHLGSKTENGLVIRRIWMTE